MSFRYVREHGDIACYYGDKVQYYASSITVAFDPGLFVLFKIGPESSIVEWAAKSRLAAKGSFDVATITSRSWEPHTLNRLLDCSGYLEQFIKEQNIFPVGLDALINRWNEKQTTTYGVQPNGGQP